MILYFSDNQNMRLQDSRFFWVNNSSPLESQRILLVNHCQTSGKIIYNLYISLVLGVYSRYLAWKFGVFWAVWWGVCAKSMTLRYIPRQANGNNKGSRSPYLSRHANKVFCDRLLKNYQFCSNIFIVLNAILWWDKKIFFGII